MEGMNTLQKILWSIISLVILTTGIPLLYPLAVSGLANMAEMGNFSFASFFDPSNGITTLILSAGVVAVIFGVLYNVWKGGKGR